MLRWSLLVAALVIAFMLLVLVDLAAKVILLSSLFLFSICIKAGSHSSG